jgi:hypothetical protein
MLNGMSKKQNAFRRKVRRTLLVGGDGIAVEDFLNRPVAEWLAHRH